ncbi:MAG: hypothetical protein M3017_05790 [Actinomycetota bacterium]|nr:hypothetical protein [Actinomycetota bacterium]
MTFSRKRLALLATLIAAVLAVAGCTTSGQPTTQSTAAPASIVASPSASASDTEDTSAGAPGDTTAPSVAAVPFAALAAPAPGVKSIHSPDKVAIDETLTPGECKVRTVDAAGGDYLPDPACTPGAIDPAVTQDNLASTICKSGYTTTVRAPVADTDKVKVLSLRQYGQTPAFTTEFDHELSRSSSAAPTQYRTCGRSRTVQEPPGTTNPKDPVETQLNKAVCSHKIALAAAQNAIAHNWVTAEKDLGL